MSLVTIVYEHFKSPKTTAVWEMKLADIAKGTLKQSTFIAEIESEIKELVKRYQNNLCTIH